MRINRSIDLTLTNLPFAISTNDIIYFESEYNDNVNRFLQMYYNEICAHFKSRGYRFIYFPRLSQELNAEILRNQFPEYTELSPEMVSLNSNFMQNFFPEEDEKYYYGPSFICYAFPRYDPDVEHHTKDAEYDAKLYMIEDYDTIYANENLSNLLNHIEIDIDYEMHMEDIPEEIFNKPCYDIDDFYFDDKDIEEAESEVEQIAKSTRKTKIKNLIETINSNIYNLNKIEKDYSVYSYYLRREIRPFTTISNIHVTNKCDIELTELGINMGLGAQMKALYLLFLNHPEGIHYLNVEECKDELIQWYKWCDPRDPSENNINNLFVVKKKERHPIVSLISRIKGEINSNLGERLGQKYHIKNIGEGFYLIDTSGYKVTIDKVNPYKKDMNPIKKSFSFI